MARVRITAEELDRRLSGFDETLTGLDLRGMVVQHDVHGATFDDCDLSNADFSKTRLSTVVFTNCDLQSISWRGANLNDVDFDSCNLFDGDFSRTLFHDVSTSECNVVGTRWKEARLEYCEFGDTNFSRAVFYTTTCTRSRFFTCNFTEAIFVGGEFAHCDFPRAVMRSSKLQSHFTSSSFRDAELERASLNETGFFGADLRTVRNAVYDSTYVREAKFSEVSPDGWSVLRRKYTGPNVHDAVSQSELPLIPSDRAARRCRRTMVDGGAGDCAPSLQPRSGIAHVSHRSAPRCGRTFRLHTGVAVVPAANDDPSFRHAAVDRDRDHFLRLPPRDLALKNGAITGMIALVA